VSVVLPPDVVRLLWDVEADSLDLSRTADRDLVIERVMGRGTLEAMRWLRSCFSKDELAAFIRAKGQARLAPRDLAYWALVTGVPAPQARGGGRPAWAGA
jgi:hypothetical protein